MIEKYPLLKDWKWVKMGDICEIIMGQSPPGYTYSNVPKGLPFFQGKADFGDYFPSMRIWCTKPLKIAEEGDILISVRAPVGPVNMSNIKCCIGRGLASIRCKNNVINWFVFWYLRSMENKISLLGSGSTFNAINRSNLIDLQIPLPSISEQKCVVVKIQQLIQEIEKIKTACGKQLEAINALPQVILKKLFIGEL